jgi:hypothetical protein
VGEVPAVVMLSVVIVHGSSAVAAYAVHEIGLGRCRRGSKAGSREVLTKNSRVHGKHKFTVLHLKLCRDVALRHSAGTLRQEHGVPVTIFPGLGSCRLRVLITATERTRSATSMNILITRNEDGMKKLLSLHFLRFGSMIRCP